LLALNITDPFFGHISNVWSDCQINSYLVQKRLAPILLARHLELCSGNLSLFIYALSKPKPSTRELRRQRIVDLLVDLSEFVPYFQDPRTSTFSRNAWAKTVNAAVPILGQKSVSKAEKLVSNMAKTPAREWINGVLTLIREQK